MKISFSKAQFIRSSLCEKELPLLRGEINGNLLPEIALVGRSNVGKSSLINHLFHNSKLAKVSSTPGKTQTLNFFSIDDALAFVDLPGYGYAKVSDQMKAHWGEAIDRYLLSRPTLKAVLQLIDIRREPRDEEMHFIQWCLHHKKPFLILFTKADKLKVSERKAQIKNSLNILSELEGIEEIPYLEYSIKDPKSKQLLIKHINTLI